MMMLIEMKTKNMVRFCNLFLLFLKKPKQQKTIYNIPRHSSETRFNYLPKQEQKT